MEREFREYSRPIFGNGNGKRDSRSREFPGIFPKLETLPFTAQFLLTISKYLNKTILKLKIMRFSRFVWAHVFTSLLNLVFILKF